MKQQKNSMTYQDMVHYLQSYKSMELQLIDYRNRMTGLKSPTYSEELKGSPRSDINPLNMYIHKIEGLEIQMESIKIMIETKLTNGHKLIIWHHYIEGRTISEIAEMMCYSETWVKDHKKYAIKELLD